MIDTGSGAVTATITVGDLPVGIAVAPDGKCLYVANSGSDSVIATESDTVTDTVPVGEGPSGMAITADGRRAYVANFHANSVSVIDTGIA